MKSTTVLLLLFLVWTAGCAVIGSRDQNSFASQGLVIPFEFHSGRIQRWFEPKMDAAINRQNCSAVELERKLAEIPVGSQVALLDESGQAYNAIVSGVGQDGLKLLNCMTNESVPGPDGSRQLKTSNTPWQTIPVQSITSCSVVESAHPELNLANEEDHCDQCVSDIIFKSGRRQSDWRSAQDDREVGRILTGRPKRLKFPRMLKSSEDD